MWRLPRGALPGWGTPGGAEGRGVRGRGASPAERVDVVGVVGVGCGQAREEVAVGGQYQAYEAVDQGSQECSPAVPLYQQVKSVFTKELLVSVRPCPTSHTVTSSDASCSCSPRGHQDVFAKFQPMSQLSLSSLLMQSDLYCFLCSLSVVARIARCVFRR